MTMARKPEASPNVVKPTADRTVPASVAQQAALRSLSGYKGNVPLTNFMGWVLLVVLGVLAMGLLLSQALISQRQDQLVEDTAARVALQGQARANLVGEWLAGVNATADTIAKAQLVRLYVAEMTGTGNDAGMGESLRAQAPYMQQVLKDYVSRNKAIGAHVLGGNGAPLVSEGAVPPALAEQPTLIGHVVSTAQGIMLPLRMAGGVVVLDVLRPVFQPSQEGTETPVSGVLWLTLPVGDKLVALAAPTAQDRKGERTAILQDVNNEAYVVGAEALASVGASVDDIMARANQGHAITLSVVDDTRTFANLAPVVGTPFTVLQEFKAADALAAMKLYKPGLYALTGLATAVLGALMLALTLHLMGQRNSTRVKLLGQTMDALVRMVEARDPYLAGHHARLAKTVVGLGNRMNLPVAERATLFYAAQLSAVGRLLIPRDLMAKKGKLTPAERRDLQTHIENAQTILGELDFDLPVVAVINQMYERMDGSGYPMGLAGDTIHRMARVLGAADAFIAMTSARSHRAAMADDMALASMKDSGQFDGAVLKVLGK
ncbi:MAG: HD domain-containing phosphohydrolase [Alphaproteobacteria bacterium]